MKILSFFFRFLFLIWFFFLVARSGLYVKRIISETKDFFSIPGENSSKTFFPEIQPCSPKPPQPEEEKYYLWQYRNLGAKCEK